MSNDLIKAVSDCESSNSNDPLIQFFRKWRKSIVYHIGSDNSSFFIVPHTPSDFRYPAGTDNGYNYFISVQQKYFDHKDGQNKETFVDMVKLLFGDLYKMVDCRNTKIVNGVVVRKHISPTNWESFAKCRREGSLMSTPAIKAAVTALEGGSPNSSIRRDSHVARRLQTLVAGEPRADGSNALHLFCKHADNLDFVGGKLTWQEHTMNNDPSSVVSGYLRAFMRETLEELVLLPPEQADALLNGTDQGVPAEEAGMCQYTPRDIPSADISFATIIVRKGDDLWVLLEFFQVTPYLCQVHVSEAPGGCTRRGAFPPPAVLSTGVSANAPARAYGTVLFENLEASVPAVDRMFKKTLVGVNGSHGKIFSKLSNVIKNSDLIKYYVQPDMDFVAAPGADAAPPAASADDAVDALAAHLLGTVLDMEEETADGVTDAMSALSIEGKKGSDAGADADADAAAALAKSLPHSVRSAEEKLLKTMYAHSRSETAASESSPAVRYLWTLHFVLIFEKQHDAVRQMLVKCIVHCRNLTEGCSLYDRARSRIVNPDVKHAIVGRSNYYNNDRSGHGHDGGSWGRSGGHGGRGRETTGSGNGHGRGSGANVEGTVFRRPGGSSGKNPKEGNKEGGKEAGPAASASAWGRGSAQPDTKPGLATGTQRKTTSAYIPGAGAGAGKPKRACSFFMNTFAGCANPKKCTFSHDMMLISQVEQCKQGCNCELRGRCPLRHIKKF